ncbi:bacillithiol biosynthesis deacetylase BshB2 [Cytobacillus sp. IB215665]|uniref:bacillithiol biosynthesis deacetylase BshB2 n=1 Tax=Cytobacillus sp. IB215665 TaxID=3097357 RepID=UPI002A0BF585|nr:bacillithiol biosynthesis deacetylase BshB2 [Cytobacillus sp. IB215665]MDX8366911.1 bacillithiol biosynthesis deacetylase BshB2 [Cytobacillus sp. IB215665]
MERHVLVVLPHPDDEAFGVGGLIAQYSKKGIPVTYACATLGEMGRNMGSPPIANRESLRMLRKTELQEACSVLGINDLRMLGFRDKTLEFEDEAKLVNSIKAVIDDVNPSMIITHYPGHGVHPDHDACGLATVKAAKKIKGDNRPRVLGHAISKNRFEVLGNPTFTADVNDVFDIKVNALKAHRTQTEGMIKRYNETKEKQEEFKKWFGTELFWDIDVDKF